jgi:hypothetical protein
LQKAAQNVAQKEFSEMSVLYEQQRMQQSQNQQFAQNQQQIPQQIQQQNYYNDQYNNQYPQDNQYPQSSPAKSNQSALDVTMEQPSSRKPSSGKPSADMSMVRRIESVEKNIGKLLNDSGVNGGSVMNHNGGDYNNVGNAIQENKENDFNANNVNYPNANNYPNASNYPASNFRNRPFQHNLYTNFNPFNNFHQGQPKTSKLEIRILAR